MKAYTIVIRWMLCCTVMTVGLNGQAEASLANESSDKASATFGNLDTKEYMTVLGLNTALALVQKGMYDAAITEVTAVLKQSPESPPGHELFGVALALKGNFDQALAEFQKAAELNPKQYTAITKMGDVYMATKQIAKAKAKFLEALAVNGADNRAHQRLGLICEDEGEVIQAIEHYEKGIIATPPAYLGVKVNLGALYNRTRQYQKTVALLEGCLRPESQNGTAFLVLGTAYLGLKQTDKALIAFARVKELEPEAAGAQVALGVAYRQAGDLKRSLEELTQATKAQPDLAAAQFQLGETLAELGRTDDAISAFERSASQGGLERTKAGNRIADLYIKLGQPAKAIATYEKMRADGFADLHTYDSLTTLYQLQGKLEAAERILNEAAQRNQDNAFVYFRKGLFYGFAKRYDEARDQLLKAAALSPADPRILQALSLAQFRAGSLPEALQTAQRVVELTHGDSEARFFLASLLEDAQKTDEAIHQYREILKQNPQHVLAMNNLAGLLASRGLLDEAQKMSETAAQLAPRNAAVLDTHGWLLFRRSNFALATNWLDKAVVAAPRNPTYRYHLGMACLKVGDTGRARRELESALELTGEFPGRPEAVKILTDLQKR